MSSPRLLSNRYELTETLGYGGMAEVHGGRDTRLGRDVAVKILRADLARDPTFQLRFRREAQNAAAMNHPAIVAVYDTGETESENGPLPYIVMEYVDGRTLRDIVKTDGPLPARRAMEVMADASAALDFSHRQGVVHRDVKPANIMITTSGAVKVMDFGIARALTDGQAAVTQTAAVIGTAQYLSPEQARGESVDARSDVYASGCVLFELLTGDPPFTGDSPVAVAYQHVREEPSKPSDHNATVPASLDAVVLKALSKNPANRYQSAAEMRSDLVRVLSGQRPKAPMIMTDDERAAMLDEPSATEVAEQGRYRTEESPPPDYGYDPRSDRKRRRRWVIALVTAVCVALVALGGWAASSWMYDPAAQQEPVPGLEGQNIASAMDQAHVEGWKATPQSCPSKPDEVDRVLRQDPPAGTQAVKTNTTITLCVGKGPEQVQVPDLSGLSMDQARDKLEQAGLDLGLSAEYQETEDESQVDKIMSWEHQGETIDKGTTVNVVLGKAVEKTEVPDMTNQNVNTARAYLEGSGFQVEVRDEDSDRPKGEVLSQDPSGGESVRPNSTVTLVVSNEQQVTVPPLTGKSAKEAEQELKKLGWTGSVSETDRPTTDRDMDDKVVGSKPGTGEKIRKNQSVTLFVGDYDMSPPTSTSESGLIPFD